MNLPHFIDEHERAGRFVCRNLSSKDRLDFVIAAAQRNDQIGMVVNVEIDGLARLKSDFPETNIFVLKQEGIADFS